jgi:hypothetical protein
LTGIGFALIGASDGFFASRHCCAQKVTTSFLFGNIVEGKYLKNACLPQ